MGDTWIYDLSDNIWRLMIPPATPSFRVVYGAASINGTKKILLFGGYDNIIGRFPRLGKLLRRVLYFIEKTPLQVLGLSHFWVIEKV